MLRSELCLFSLSLILVSAPVASPAANRVCADGSPKVTGGDSLVSPAALLSKRAGGDFLRKNFDFAAVEAQVTDYRLKPDGPAGVRSLPCWGEATIEVLEVLGETEPGAFSSSSTATVIDCFPVHVVDGDFQYLESSTVRTDTELWNELLIGVGDKVLMLVGKARTDDVACEWWAPYISGQEKYAICLVRHVVGDSESEPAVVFHISNAHAKAATLPNGVLDAAKLVREEYPDRASVMEWKSALRQFVSTATH